MPRVLLLLPTATYRAPDFIAAARALDVEIVVASEEMPVLAATMGDRAVAVPLDDADAAATTIQELDERRPIDAVIAVDDQGVVIAAQAGERLGFPHNPPDAAIRTRDKAAMRVALEAVEVPQPKFSILPPEPGDDDRLPDFPLPWVVKPTQLSGSRGVIRADNLDAARATIDRVRAIAGDGPVMVEEYVPGVEVALEGLLRNGELTVLALFDKPDPLEGPYFEETIYVTPSRLSEAVQADVARVAAEAAAALGLREGPVHAELRIDEHDTNRVRVIEVAARSIGGLCARALRFGAGISLEEVILMHALGRNVGELRRESRSAGVMMIPIPRSGRLAGVDGLDAARAVPGVDGIEITVPNGRVVHALPEGDRYLGFAFARGETPDDVERSLRAAHTCLDIHLLEVAVDVVDSS